MISTSARGAELPLDPDYGNPYDEWTEIFGSERLTGALLDRHPK